MDFDFLSATAQTGRSLPLYNIKKVAVSYGATGLTPIRLATSHDFVIQKEGTPSRGHV